MFSSDKNVCSVDKFAAAFLAVSVISQFPEIKCRFSRKYSRAVRLIRLRTAAFPTLFETVIPRRVLCCCPGAYLATKCRWWSVFPNLNKWLNSERFKILSALVKQKRKRYLPSVNHRFFKAPLCMGSVTSVIQKSYDTSMSRSIPLNGFCLLLDDD